MDSSVCLPTQLGWQSYFPYQTVSSKEILPIENYDRETSSILLPVKEINRLKRQYVFQSASQVEHFIFNKKEVIPVLAEIYWHLVDKFQGSPVYLELSSDPEENYEGLFVEVGSVLPLDESMTLLDQIVDWFIESVPDEIREYLTITLK